MALRVLDAIMLRDKGAFQEILLQRQTHLSPLVKDIHQMSILCPMQFMVLISFFSLKICRLNIGYR